VTVTADELLYAIMLHTLEERYGNNSMADYQITYWREIPAMVTAREGRRNTAKVELPERFQTAIDTAAMRSGLVGTDAYLDQWRRSPWQEREGEPAEVARLVAAEIQNEYTPDRIREIVSASIQQ
jgi:hypothetical protein